jgi:hypothetical protein
MKLRAVSLLFAASLVACTPGQNGPLTLTANDACVTVYVYGNPTGGTATTTATIPASAIPAKVGGAYAATTDVPTLPSITQTCTLTKRDTSNTAPASTR